MHNFRKIIVPVRKRTDFVKVTRPSDGGFNYEETSTFRRRKNSESLGS